MTTRAQGYRFVAFDETMLEPAAELLAERHTRNREQRPLLPQRYTKPVAARTALSAVWQHEHTSGVAAWQNGQLAGYLIGEVKIDTLRGRIVWMHLPGHALAPGQPAELSADLYAAAAPEWVRWGAFNHYIMAPAGDESGLGIWFSLGFGQEQAVALRSLTISLPETPPLPASVSVRTLVETDQVQFVSEMSSLLSAHMTQAPVWGVALPEYDSVRRKGFADLLADVDVQVWGAFEDGHILGYQIIVPITTSAEDIIVPERCCLLELAATRPEARGRGIGRALTAVILAAARDQGNETCLMDWRTTNLEARRFWTAMGFQPVAYRLTRQIDPRIAWAGRS